MASGTFSAGVTVLAYVGTNTVVPTGGCQEAGGESQGFIRYGEALWVFGGAALKAKVLSNSTAPRLL